MPISADAPATLAGLQDPGLPASQAAADGIENVGAAIDQIAQTTDRINLDIRKILDVSTVAWGWR
jgi:hypothetical protein